MEQALGYVIYQYVCAFCLDHSMGLVVLSLGIWFSFDFYRKYVRVNEDTYNVDLMYRYMWLKLDRRYRG
jgi:hypothetical protein